MKRAPFTPDEVESLNGYQCSGVMHPFTCGSGNRRDAAHTDGEGVLVAQEDGWHCPFCDYRQSWCHPWMADWSWRTIFQVPGVRGADRGRAPAGEVS